MKRIRHVPARNEAPGGASAGSGSFRDQKVTRKARKSTEKPAFPARKEPALAGLSRLLPRGAQRFLARPGAEYFPGEPREVGGDVLKGGPSRPAAPYLYGRVRLFSGQSRLFLGQSRLFSGQKPASFWPEKEPASGQKPALFRCKPASFWPKAGSFFWPKSRLLSGQKEPALLARKQYATYTIVYVVYVVYYYLRPVGPLASIIVLRPVGPLASVKARRAVFWPKEAGFWPEKPALLAKEAGFWPEKSRLWPRRSRLWLKEPAYTGSAGFGPEEAGSAGVSRLLLLAKEAGLHRPKPASLAKAASSKEAACCLRPTGSGLKEQLAAPSSFQGTL